jgi:hypothetical protein
MNIPAKVTVVCNRKFLPSDYISAINKKYVHCENIEFDSAISSSTDVSLVMGRSQISLAYIGYEDYTKKQQDTLKKLFSGRLISVYSENHPEIYPRAVSFFSPTQIIDLCDHEVYINGVGEHFEKTIHFDIHKPIKNNIQFEHLFLGTNQKYYATVQEVIDQYPDHGILTYHDKYIDPKNNNVFAPVDDIMGMFETYVYTKNTFDPAPRIFQECRYFGKNVIYQRDKSIVDGGSVYWNRELKKPDIEPIIKAVEDLA